MSPSSITELGGTTRHLLTLVNPLNDCWTAFNPALGKTSDGQLFCVIRASNYVADSNHPSGWRVLIEGYGFKNVLYYGNITSDYRVVDLEPIKLEGGPRISRGLEDPRVFQREDGWYLLATMLEDYAPQPRIIIYKLDLKTKVASFSKLYESWSTSNAEKNWMPTYDKANPNFDFIYSPTGVYKDGKIILSMTSNKNLNGIRGGSPLYPLNDGSYISICHVQHVEQRAKILENKVKVYGTPSYSHVFVRYDNYGKVIEKSPEFVFEDYQIEFASGLVEHEGNFLITYGVNDLTSSLAIIPKGSVLKMLSSVDEEPEDWDE